MAGGLQYATTANFFAYTATAAASSPSYPPAQLADWNGTHPLARPWQSLTTLANALSFNFGSVRSGTWVALLNANFTQVQIGIGNGTVFTDIVTGGAYVTRTIAKDWADPEGYYKLFLATPYSGSVGRLEIPPQATTDGAAYFTLGAVLWGTNLVTMTHYFHDPLQEDFVDPEYRVAGKDWEEAYPAGIRSKTLVLRNLFRNSESPEWHALRLLRPGARVMLYHNQDNAAEVYIAERNRPMTITRHSMHQEVNTGLRTVA